MGILKFGPVNKTLWKHTGLQGGTSDPRYFIHLTFPPLGDIFFILDIFIFPYFLHTPYVIFYIFPAGYPSGYFHIFICHLLSPQAKWAHSGLGLIPRFTRRVFHIFFCGLQEMFFIFLYFLRTPEMYI